MIRIFDADGRGTTRVDWLHSRHSFSFAGWNDPERMGFSSLRVLNDDWIAPGGGFGFHPHRDMEILTWVVEGALEHRDSLGHTSILRAGEIQLMSAGTGIVHSERNASGEAPLRFFQIWVTPGRDGLRPGYQELSGSGPRGVVASPDGRDGSLLIHQGAVIRIERLARGDRAVLPLGPDRSAWIHTATGSVRVGNRELTERDGAAVVDEPIVEVTTSSEGEVILFDVERPT